VFGLAMASRDHPNLVLATCILASSLAFVDGSVTNVALPAIGKDLHATAAELQAAGTGFLLAQARGQGFGGGYFDHAGQLWSESGTLLATTHQVMYYKE